MANDVNRLLVIFRETLDNDDISFEADSQEPIADWDSLAHVQLMLAIEEAYDVTLSTDEMATMNSVPAILSVLRQKGVSA